MIKSYDIHPALRDAPREHTLCVTGHRPAKLPKGEKQQALIKTIQYYLDIAIEKGYTHFLNGLADGTDYLMAEYLFQIREKRPGIQIIGIQPCEDYEVFFKKRNYDLKHLQRMKEQVNALICLPGSWRDEDIFFTRNRMLVDHASAVIAVCSDRHSGAMQTLHYAKECGLAWCQIAANPELLYTPPPEQWPVIRNGF